jgi:tetratricopeptide (TPR) repeat protein
MVPFGPFSDAFLPVLQGLDPDVLRALVPSGEDALLSLFPPLGSPGRRLHEADGQPGEPQARLFWHFSSLVARLADYRPLLLIVEDLDYADRSSLEIFHFLARQCTDKPVFLIGQYSGIDPKRKRELLGIEQSLIAAGAGTAIDLGPFAAEETEEFIRRAFDLEGRDTRKLASRVHQWTGGNPFFLTGTLRGLVEAGVLRRRDGSWTGLDATDVEVPHSLRDSVMSWMSNVSEPALELARLVAILGRQVPYEVLVEVSEKDREGLARALDELLRHQILADSEERFTLVYDFRHPLIREALRGELSLSERRHVHFQVGSRLERLYAESADLRADELAYHFGQANPGEAGDKAIRYLTTAGFAALDRYANREGVGYLQEALDRIEARPRARAATAEVTTEVTRLVAGLARGKRRLGDAESSVAFGRRVLALAQADGNLVSIAKARREIGLSFMAGGLFEEAIEELEQARESASEAAAPELVIRLLLAQGYCLHAVGRGETAETAVRRALPLAEELGRQELVGRVHGALMRMHIWTGKLNEVREHAERALRIARACGDTNTEFWSEWAMGAMEGLIGHTEEMARRVERARELATSIGSPLLRLEITELEVELLYARGEWDEALAVGGPAIELARSLDARTILPRLLVWGSQIHLGRGDLEIVDQLTREAWDASGADAALGAPGFLDVHTVVPAHIGRAAYHLARGDWGDAARIAEAGLAIADRTGYVVWAIHHVLPIIGEASIHARDLLRAREIGIRMRREAEALGHPLGLAWADTCDAVLTWLEGDPRQGALALRKAAEALGAIPLVYESNRVRRQLAGRLAELGDRDGALAELRRVHAVFARLGARAELAKTVEQFGQLGAEPSV